MSDGSGSKAPKNAIEEVEGRIAVSPFRLERLYENISAIFKSSKVANASTADVLIAVDTNVLLLPFTLSKDGLPTLLDVYRKLKAERRLFLPARAAREFITLRDKKLAELLHNIAAIKSKINIGEAQLSPILDGLSGGEQLKLAAKALADAKKQYTKALSNIEEEISSWSGNDPVTNLYSNVFDAENIVTPLGKDEEILSEWDSRQREQIPPGYKDRNKPDTGIGDFLIWKTLLRIGSEKKKDLIFVTGDEKADWFVRVNGHGAYPRPELIAEYRKHSDGGNIRFASLHDVLREMRVENGVVSAIQDAENAANDFYRSEVNLDFFSKSTVPSTPLDMAPKVANFSLRYGGEDLIFLGSGAAFSFNVSEHNKNSIWVYPNSSLFLYKLEMGHIGALVDLSALSPMKSNFSITRGEIVFARDRQGNVLAARLDNANMPQPNERFEVSMVYCIYPYGSGVLIP